MNSATGYRVPVLVAVIALLLACSPLPPGSKTCSLDTLPQHYLALVNALSPSQQVWPAQRWQDVDCSLVSLANVPQAQQAWRSYIDLRGQQQRLVGYKVALGSPASQQLFALSAPVVGAFFDGELMPQGQVLSVAAGRKLAFEADLLVEIGSEAINQARSIEQVAQSVSTLYAFIEVPDLMVPLAPTSGPAFIATNAAARYGIYGDSIEARDDPAFITALGAMQVSIEDAGGKQLGSASGAQLMGHPYQALLFLVEALAGQGMQLRVGDLVSLGAFGPPVPVALGDERVVRYRGLGDTGELRVEARFR